MRKYIVLLILAAFITSSCVQEVNLDADFIRPKLVLYGRLCPQLDTLLVSLSISAQLFNPEENIGEIKNPVIEISRDKDNWTRLQFSYERFRFFVTQEEFPILEGKTYYIRASADGFETIHSQATVPYKRAVNLTVSLDSAGTSEWDEIWYHYTISFQDYQGEENYYSLMETRDRIEEFWDENGDWVSGPYTSLDPIYDYNYDEGVVFSDKDKDGKMFYMKYLKYFWDLETEIATANLKIYMMQLDKHAYMYEKSYAEHGEYIGFFMEPGSVYNNIENGFGLFSAFTLEEHDFIFE